MILTDTAIRALCLPNPYRKAMLEPFIEGEQGKGTISRGLSHAGYDLRLGRTVLVFKNTYNEVVDPKAIKDETYMARIFDKMTDLADSEAVIIPPDGYILGSTMEYIRMPRHLKGTCVGKSTLARCGIGINTTPIEPGWEGFLTLEIANHTPCPVKVYVAEGIAQLEFHLLHGELGMDYEQKDGKYQRQGAGPVPGKVKE